MVLVFALLISIVSAGLPALSYMKAANIRLHPKGTANYAIDGTSENGGIAVRTPEGRYVLPEKGVVMMPNIKAISDLRNYNEVLRDIAVDEPFFTKK